MEQAFKHPQIFADLLSLLQTYYPVHNRMPKGFRFTVGEQVLQELGHCMRLVVQANGLDKNRAEDCARGALADLSQRMEGIARQAARWQQWFAARAQAQPKAGAPDAPNNGKAQEI